MLDSELIDAMYELSNREYQNNLYKNNNLWDDYHIVDENQSVKWNKEQIIEHNDSIYKEYREVANQIIEERIKLHDKAFLYFKDRWEDTQFTKIFFQEVWNRAVNQCESYSDYCSIFGNINDILGDFYDLLELRENKNTINEDGE